MQHTIKSIMIGSSLLITGLGYSQVQIEVPSEYVSNTTRGGVNSLQENVQGSPYPISDFKPGRVTRKGGKSYPALLRYNAYVDVIEMQGEGDPIYLVREPNLEIKILNQDYRLLDFKAGNLTKKGYFVVLNEDGPARLLLRRESEFFEKEEALSSYSMSKPARFETEEEYYLQFGDKPAVPVRLKRKDILGEFPKHQDEMERYVKENKLKLKDTVEVIQLIKYFNSKAI